jgi:uroporphyrinogen-III synthase
VRRLHGIGVLVTRPEEQAAPLCRLLETEGAASFRLPALAIEPVDAAIRPAAGAADDPFELIIFTSANAVRFGIPQLRLPGDAPSVAGAPALAAVGPATAHALHLAGHRAAVQPDQSFDSEGLLAHPRLRELRGRRILLVKGCGGRELLAEELRRRGAALEVAEVYRRVPARPAAAALQSVDRALAADAVQVVTATSLEIGANLLAMAPPSWRTAFDRLLWLVPGERVAAGLRQLGVHAPLLRADSAEDQDLVTALVRWRSSVSGA